MVHQSWNRKQHRQLHFTGKWDSQACFSDWLSVKLPWWLWLWLWLALSIWIDSFRIFECHSELPALCFTDKLTLISLGMETVLRCCISPVQGKWLTGYQGDLLFGCVLHCFRKFVFQRTSSHEWLKANYRSPHSFPWFFFFFFTD